MEVPRGPEDGSTVIPAARGAELVGGPLGAALVAPADPVVEGVADWRGRGVRDWSGSAPAENDGLTDAGCGDASATLSPPGRLAVTAAAATPSTKASTIATTTAMGEITGAAD